MNADEYSRIGFCEGKVTENNVISFLDRHARLCPEKIALQWVAPLAFKDWNGISSLPHQSLSYKDLAGMIDSAAAGLKQLGIGKADRVIIFVPLSVELYVAMFAVQRIGAIAVFLDSWARKDHLGVCAQVVTPLAMISFEKAFTLCAAVPEMRNIRIKVVVGAHGQHYASSLESLTQSKGHVNIEPVGSNDTALITFTTGSSGIPKGADRTHRFLAAQHRALEKEIPYKPDDRDLPVFPIFSLNNLAGAVTTVLPAIDLAAPSEQDAALIVNQLFSAGISCCTVSPSLFVAIARHCRKSKILLHTLRRVVTGGAPVSKDDVRDFKAIAPSAEIIILYGSTEVEPIAHIEAADMLARQENRQGVNVGRISEDLEYKFIKICREDVWLTEKGWQEWEIKDASPGELIVSGAHVCENYYNNPAAFKSTKIQEFTGKIWHRTGDVGLLDEQGMLWLVGRVHNTIIRGNQYIFPVHAEILLKRLDFVRQAALVGIKDSRLGEKACVVFSLPEGTSRDAWEHYKQAITDLFKQHEIPFDEIHMVDDIPMDPRHHSKVEYSKLRKMLTEHE